MGDRRGKHNWRIRLRCCGYGWRGSESGSSYGEIVEEVVRVPHGKAQPPRAVPPLAMNVRKWLNMVNVKPPYRSGNRKYEKIFWSKSIMLKSATSTFTLYAAISGGIFETYVQSIRRRNGTFHVAGTRLFFSARLHMCAVESSRK